MAQTNRFPLRTFLLLTALPALLIGAGLWFVSDLLPSCVLDERSRLISPDGQFDLVIFSRDCGAATGANTQAALIPAGDDLPDDAASFAAVGASAELDPQWDGLGNIALSLPTGAEIYRQDDAVAGIDVIYR